MSDLTPSIEHLFRHKYGEILAALLRSVGHENFDAAEDAVQAAFQRGVERWIVSGVPENAAGWLYAVARNAYLEAARRRSTERVKVAELQHSAAERNDPTLFNAGGGLSPDGPDDLAVMLLLCCNPDLSPRAQVCLTLKSACGFSVREIARALDMQDEAVKRSITRAKEKVSQSGDVFHALETDRVAERFALVMDALYAMFTEGYAASSGDTQLRRDVAEEAIRLVRVFLGSSLTPDHHRPTLLALLALMLLQFARFDARIDGSGLPVRMQEQDRSRWQRPMIQAGVAALAASRSPDRPTVFHLEARIAAEHALSPSFAGTNWATILSLYGQLLTRKDTLAVRLSRIVALRYAHGWQLALDELEQFERDTSRGTAASFLLHAVRADLLEAAGRTDDAVAAWERARGSAPTAADRAFIDAKVHSSADGVPDLPSRSS